MKSNSESPEGQCVVSVPPLEPAEVATLAECEAAIERGMKSFVEVGKALATIRDSKLYRATHETFEKYVKDRWDFGRAHAYRQIAAFEAMQALSPRGDILPQSEGQIRPLLQFKPEHRAEVWEDVVRQAPVDEKGNKLLPVRHVESVVKAEIRVSQAKPYKARRAEIRAKRRAQQEEWDQQAKCVAEKAIRRKKQEQAEQRNTPQLPLSEEHQKLLSEWTAALVIDNGRRAIKACPPEDLLSLAEAFGQLAREACEAREAWREARAAETPEEITV